MVTEGKDLRITLPLCFFMMDGGEGFYWVVRGEQVLVTTQSYIW